MGNEKSQEVSVDSLKDMSELLGNSLEDLQIVLAACKRFNIGSLEVRQWRKGKQGFEKVSEFLGLLRAKCLELETMKPVGQPVAFAENVPSNLHVAEPKEESKAVNKKASKSSE